MSTYPYTDRAWVDLTDDEQAEVADVYSGDPQSAHTHLRMITSDQPALSMDERLYITTRDAVRDIKRAIRKNYDRIDERPEFGEFEARVLVALG